MKRDVSLVGANVKADSVSVTGEEERQIAVLDPCHRFVTAAAKEFI